MTRNAEFDAALARLAVDLLAGTSGDLNMAAEAAIRRRLAGLFRYGLSAHGIDEDRLSSRTAAGLLGAARREAGEDALYALETEEVLRILEGRGHRPVVLKGRMLALEVWPHPAHRPAGDLDLLLEREAVRDSSAALRAAGYTEQPLWWHRELSTAVLIPPEGRQMPVDLHWRPFEIVGSRIDTVRLLRRARPAMLAGRPVLSLAEPDRLLHLLVHAAKHGFRGLKWLLDLYAVGLRTDSVIWRQAAERAVASGTSRPCHVAAAVLASLPGLSVDRESLRAVQPSRPIRALLDRMVSLRDVMREDSPSRPERYALGLLLEPSLPASSRRAWRLLRKFVLDRT